MCLWGRPQNNWWMLSLDQLTSSHWKRVRHATNRCKRWRRGQGTASSKPAELKMSPRTQFSGITFVPLGSPFNFTDTSAFFLTTPTFSWWNWILNYQILENWYLNYQILELNFELPNTRELNDFDEDLLGVGQSETFCHLFLPFLAPLHWILGVGIPIVQISSFPVAHSCTRFPCYLGMEIYAETQWTTTKIVELGN